MRTLVMASASHGDGPGNVSLERQRTRAATKTPEAVTTLYHSTKPSNLLLKRMARSGPAVPGASCEPSTWARKPVELPVQALGIAVDLHPSGRFPSEEKPKGHPA